MNILERRIKGRAIEKRVEVTFAFPPHWKNETIENYIRNLKLQNMNTGIRIYD